LSIPGYDNRRIAALLRARTSDLLAEPSTWWTIHCQ
jgi:hypothetical protein